VTVFVVHHPVMIMVNVAQARANLGKLIAAAEAGERVVICRRNKPVAELRIAGSQRRPVGLGAGSAVIHESFHRPMTIAELAASHASDGRTTA
jgi:antitoxin (DNA-binding transcriptional repressor) of toxin-antitoxin stability system